MFKKLTLGLALFGFCVISYTNYSCKLQSKVDYSTQIKPILNKHCITCHGGVKKQGGFSLLFKEEAYAKSKSGKYAIVPGHASKSEMIKRLSAKDPEERMPYQKEPLSKEEIELLTKWIDEGAEWGEHWAYQTIEKPEIPEVSDDWIQNPIDNFVIQKGKSMGLSPSKKADNISLARRLSLDIIGFPMNSNPKTQYLNKPNLDNYEKLVDDLLSSKHYGEKWASMWLDLARYADTKGYERDDSREIWRYRDYLIASFNEDKPYSVFLTEQIAGDLLENPSENQYIATAFHRNTMTNDEGGTDNEEFRTAAVIDRVNTTWETLMGTTFSCIQCHSHPYDPIRHDEYYKFMAFFNNSRDEDSYGDYPKLRHFDASQNAKMQQLEAKLKNSVSAQEKTHIVNFLKTLQPSYNSLVCDDFKNAELADTKWLSFRNRGSARLKNVNLSGKTNLIFQLKVFVAGGTLKITKGSTSGEAIALLNVSKLKADGKWQIIELPLKPSNDKTNLYFSYQNTALTNPDANGLMIDWLYFNANTINSSPKEIKTLYWDLLTAQTPSTPIMMENHPDFFRETHVFERGSWLSKGKIVAPDVPLIFGGLAKNAPKNRLGLATWMTDPKNPLVARTMVNRVWEQLFGYGLVETLEDLGTQSASPANKELLDYLSYKFIHDYNWSIKKLMKEIVMSATYQQDSRVTDDQLQKDPTNKYLCRGPRIRLTAEQIRDQALAVSGILSTKMYGPPVKPFQPEGIWFSPYNGAKWLKSEGEDQYRRAIYTYWKRTSPYPSMMSFDGVGREVCVSRRIRTNTPLQALVTLNDSVYIDISKKLAEKAFEKSNKDMNKSIQLAYKMVTERSINQQKLAVLNALYQKTLKEYLNKPALSKQFKNGKNNQENAQMAALVLVCNSILNLDEVISKS